VLHSSKKWGTIYLVELIQEAFMFICVLTVPSNKTYGFDGVSDEKFELFQSNITKILNKTDLCYDEELNPGTDCANYLWSDSDSFTVGDGAFGTTFEAVEEGDEIVNISDDFFNQVQCGYDLFVELTPEVLNDAVKTVDSILAPYAEAIAA
jgi:hypothetical protein